MKLYKRQICQFVHNTNSKIYIPDNRITDWYDSDCLFNSEKEEELERNICDPYSKVFTAERFVPVLNENSLKIRLEEIDGI